MNEDIPTIRQRKHIPDNKKLYISIPNFNICKSWIYCAIFIAFV